MVELGGGNVTKSTSLEVVGAVGDGKIWDRHPVLIPGGGGRRISGKERGQAMNRPAADA